MNKNKNYFKAPWMPDRTEANPNELNQDDARYGFRCCHLKNIWTAPLPTETELSRQMTTSTTSIDIMGLQASYANLHTDQECDFFFSSRRRHTSYIGDWSSDVCSSDLWTSHSGARAARSSRTARSVSPTHSRLESERTRAKT